MRKGTKLNLTDAERERRRQHGRNIALHARAVRSARLQAEREAIDSALAEVGRRMKSGELPNPMHEDQILEEVRRIFREREVEQCLRDNPDMFIDHGDGTYSLAEWGCTAPADIDEAFARSGQQAWT